MDRNMVIWDQQLTGGVNSDHKKSIGYGVGGWLITRDLKLRHHQEKIRNPLKLMISN